MIDGCVACWAGLFCRNGNTLHPTRANESTNVMNTLKAVLKRFCNFCISRPVSADTAHSTMLRPKVITRPMAPRLHWLRTSNEHARQTRTTLTIRPTRNPTCPNRWGSHERCRFIGGRRRVGRYTVTHHIIN